MITIQDIYQELQNKGYYVNISGDETVEISNFCSLNNPKDNSITWVRNVSADILRKFNGNRQNIIVAKEYVKNDIEKCGFIICDNPKEIFFVILNIFFSTDEDKLISNKSTILTHNIGSGVSIGDNCYIGKDVIIGDNVTISNNVTIKNKVVIGRDCIINSGVVIGTDGFGYYFDDENVPHKVPHFGGVKIGSNVEVGANACIDRGTIDDTVIGDNSKIDNLCHIAHNVVIGSNVIVIAGSVVCGSVKVNDEAYIAPGAIIKDNITISEKSLIGMGSVVMNNTNANCVYVGTPAHKIRERSKKDI